MEKEHRLSAALLQVAYSDASIDKCLSFILHGRSATSRLQGCDLWGTDSGLPGHTIGAKDTSPHRASLAPVLKDPYLAQGPPPALGLWRAVRGKASRKTRKDPSSFPDGNRKEHGMAKLPRVVSGLISELASIRDELGSALPDIEGQGRAHVVHAYDRLSDLTANVTLLAGQLTVKSLLTVLKRRIRRG
jgi:hypothetical protein